MSAGVTKPADADALAKPRLQAGIADFINNTDDLMSRDDRVFGIWQVGIDNMEVRTTDSAGFDTNPNLSRTRMRIGDILEH
jgi:hypothetical protein